MLSIEDVANFEGLLKIADKSLKDANTLYEPLTQLLIQKDNIAKNYNLSDSLVLGDIIEGVRLLILNIRNNSVENNKKFLPLLEEMITEFEDLRRLNT